MKIEIATQKWMSKKGWQENESSLENNDALLSIFYFIFAYHGQLEGHVNFLLLDHAHTFSLKWILYLQHSASIFYCNVYSITFN